LKVLKLDTEENPELVVAHGVRAAPTLALFYSGLERWRMVGFRPKARLEAELEEVMAELSA
jgi:thioredoxin 1